MRRIHFALFHFPVWLFRWTKRIAIALVLLFAVLAGAWQFWFIPRLNDYRPLLIEQLAQATGAKVSIGQISGGWQWLRPQIEFSEFAMGTDLTSPALLFQKLDATLSIWTLFSGALHFDQIHLQSPELEVARAADGVWKIGGVALSKQDSGDHRLLDWFLSQGELRIADGKLRFRDALAQFPSLEVTEFDFVTDQFFATHRFELAFSPPKSLGPRIKLQGRFQGRDVAELLQGSGWLKAQVPQTNLAKLMPWLGQWWPEYAFLQGWGRVDLRLEFAKSRLQSLEADVGIKDWMIKSINPSVMYSLPVFDGSLFWTDTPKGKALKLEGRRIVSSSGALCESCSLNWTQTASGSALSLRQWQLSGMNVYLPLLKEVGNAIGARIAQGSYSGLVKKAALSWQSTLSQPKALQTEFTLENFKLIHSDLSVGPLNVSAQIQERGGRLDLDGQSVLFNFPAQFVDPVIFAEAHTRLEWQKQAKDWQFDVVDLSLMNPALQLKVKANYSGPVSGLGKVKLSGDIGHLSANQVYRYLPRILGDDVLLWLQQALLAGRASDGKIVWQGEVAGFPYSKGSKDESRGRFAIDAKAHDVTLNYVAGWPQIEEIDGRLAFEGLAMNIDATTGLISNTQLSEVSVQIPNLETDQHVLVKGKASGKTSDFLQFVANSPVKDSTNGFLDNLLAQGAGTLGLTLDLPINDIDRTKVAGHYQFKHNQLNFGGAIPLLNAANGRVEFTENTLKVPNAEAKAMGGSVKLVGVNEPSGALALSINGDAAMSEIASEYLPALQKRISGQTKYRAQLKIEPKQFDLTLNTDLQGAQLVFPEPLGKAADVSRALQVKAGGNAQQTHLTFSVGELLNGRLQSNRAGAETVQQVGIHLGRDLPSLPSQGILLTGHWPSVNVDDWLKLSDEVSDQGQSPLPLIQVKKLSFAQVAAWGRLLNGVSLNAKLDRTSWLFDLDGKELQGQFNWSPNQRQVTAKLEKLWLPLALSDTVQSQFHPVAEQKNAFDTPSAWPAVNLSINDLRYKKLELGQLNAIAVPQPQAVAIEQLQLKNSDGVFELAGAWTQRDGKNKTAGKVELTSPSVGRLLARFGYPEAMKLAPLHFSGDANWQGVPWAPQLDSLQGQFKIDVGAGRFVQVDPGVGRFLTVLNLQAIPRRLKLDFDDVISQGFAFDRITGDAQMEFGVAKTKNLLIDAPSAKVRFQGDANFVAGTQNIVVKIIPSVADTVALGVAVINPVAGLATYAAQKILDQDPIGQLVSFEYLIDGTMRDPQVKKLN
ncbi:MULTISPECIES: YhdP family protein [Deefgea]|uniref:TIGR02099 family protein n=1 Tax=Deefgea chitinilytica TaxID=570276 RepID=A0ABS2C8D2_9NEIS|nr:MULTISPECIES: YhdP family protein [Deefgea]MBM5570409.1 TIGR02099 family protein [Deefgea chitinilytica]MBM9887638.1 TIGR02099 family protein [Deefgea sp. CFH1-16]